MDARLSDAAARLRHPRTWLRNWWRGQALRTKLVMMITGLMLLLVAVTASVTAVLFRQELVRQLDEDLAGNREAVSMYLIGVAQSGGYATAPRDYYAPQHEILRFYGALWDTTGETVVSTPRRADADQPALEEMTLGDVLARGSDSFEVPGTAPDSDGWRVQLYHLRTGEGSLAIALPLASVSSSVERVVTLVVTIGLLATAASVAIANLAVRRAFRTLNRVERTAAKIAAGDLTQRVETAPPDTEVGRLSRSLNAMLAHIESAFRDKEVSEDKMRRFVQDASHELRTPLVTIRGFSELYRHGGIQDPEDVATAMGRIESEANRMHRLVEDLLTLARLDEQRPLEHEPVDLLVVGMDSLTDASVTAPDRRVSLVGLDDGRASSAPVMGDENRIRQVVANLLTNALRYTPAGTPIEIAVGTRDGVAGAADAAGVRDGAGSRDGSGRHSVIEVRDHGHGVSEEDAARIFERFFRADSSRHRETGGTGLGLAIVAAIVAQHGGSVRLLETDGGGATFSVHLPWAPFTDLDEDLEDELDGTSEGEAPGGAAPGTAPRPAGGRSDDGGPRRRRLRAGDRRRLLRAGDRFRRAAAQRSAPAQGADRPPSSPEVPAAQDPTEGRP